MAIDDERQGMTPQSPLQPRYNHLLEVLDGAASLRMAILQAEEALMEPDLSGEDRSLLESVLDVSRDRLDRVASALEQPNLEAFEAVQSEPGDVEREWSERELLEAGKAASDGSDEAERDAARAIDRLGRSMKTSARACIETFLSHSSAPLRAASMKVLALHWRLREYTGRVLWSLASDNDPDCRRAAALCLGSLYEGTRDHEIGHELVEALTRANEEEDVRWASYYALLDLDGRLPSPRPLPIHEFDLDRDVDPEMLTTYGADA